jgi:hypothetical protein
MTLRDTTTKIPLLIFTLLLPSNAYAWSTHSLITEISLSGNKEKLFSLKLKESYPPSEDNTINKNYALLYRHKLLSPDEILDNDLNEKRPEGVKIPNRFVSIFNLLAVYSSEPEWGMDRKVDTGFVSRFMGGSQGLRHMYYPSLSIHFPLVLIPMGKAPERAEHYTNLAIRAFGEGNQYWGWRYAAWALHYLQDLGQPYHTRQTYYKFIVLFSPVKGTTRVTKNYHITFERFTSFLLIKELNEELPPTLLNSLLGCNSLMIDGRIEDFAKGVAQTSNKMSGDAFTASVNLFPDELMEPRKGWVDKSEAERIIQSESFENYLEVASNALCITGDITSKYVSWIQKQFEQIHGEK